MASTRVGGPPASMARSTAAGTFRSVASRRPISSAAAGSPVPARPAAPNRRSSRAAAASARLGR
ncbi:MAG: hypothetical protein ACRDOL_18805 [Streptosporangiaceae bacterium]